MKNLKKPDGTIVEVEDDYTPLEGEEITEEEITVTEGKEEGKEGEEDEKGMKEDLKSFIKSETIDSLDKELEKKSDELVKKFFAGVEKQRKVAINAGGTDTVKATDQEVVRKWLGCLLHRDHAGMALLQKDYLQVGDNAQGGYLVPPQLLAEVNRFTEEYGVARSDMRYLPFSGPGNERTIPALASSVSVYWLAEGAAKTSTKPTFGLVTQTLEKLAAIVPMTEELLEDSAINIIALLGELFGEAVAAEEDRVFLAGDTGDGDPFMGVINAVGAVAVAMGAGDVAADIDADDLNNLIYAVPRAIRNKGIFYLSSTLFQAIQQLKTTTGAYIVQSPVGSQPGSIWNRPYKLVDVLPSSAEATAETPIMFYTDLRKTCVYGDKGGLKVKLLDQAIVSSAETSPSDLNLATQDMIALRIVKRTGYVPVLPAGIAVLSTGVAES